MKAFLKVTVPMIIAFLMLVPIVASATPIDVVHSKYKNLFVFTTQRAMRGADVKVFHANGDLVTTQELKRRKMIIDFCDVKSGEYTIVIRKGKRTEEFQYIRK